MSNEIKVGITVLLAVIVAIAGFRFMRDVPILRQSMEIAATFERVDGISSGSVVNINGVKVGSVNRVSLTPDNNVRLTMRIDTDVNIPRGSVAFLTSLGIVEGKSIIIELGDSSEMVEYGEEIEGHYVESMMEVLGNKGEELGEDVSDGVYELNKFLRQLNETLTEETRMNVNQTLVNAERATGQIATTLEEKQREIDQAIDSGSRMLSQLDTMVTDNRPKVDSLMTSLEYNINELAAVRVELEKATSNLNEILEKINDGDGTLGRLVNDPSMYENLDSLSVEINNLVKGINENPGRYLRHMSLIEIF